MLPAVRPRHQLGPALRRVSLVALVALAARAAASSHNTSAPPAAAIDHDRRRATALDDTLRLDQVQVLGSHNSYHGRPYPQVLAALYKSTPGARARRSTTRTRRCRSSSTLGVRQIELDVWSDPPGGKYAQAVVPDRRTACTIPTIR